MISEKVEIFGVSLKIWAISSCLKLVPIMCLSANESFPRHMAGNAY